MKIEKYQQSRKSKWDSFVQGAKNGHFLFMRDFMEYHADRFEDHSLMFFKENDQLIALLPANVDGQYLYSHQGLTFGGFIINERMTTKTMLTIFDQLKVYLSAANIQKLIYKCIPFIYHLKSAEEDRYALFRNDATLVRRDVSSVIAIDEKIVYSSGRKWGINKAKKSGIELKESKDFEGFWSLLENVLQTNHQVSPVHNKSEIRQLASLFPDHIKLFVAIREQEILAGCVIFENNKTAHLQYMANSVEGRKSRALDLLINHLITNVYAHKKYFDFGISTENGGQYLNEGLISQKEEFGACAVVHDFYELEIE